MSARALAFAAALPLRLSPSSASAVSRRPLAARRVLASRAGPPRVAPPTATPPSPSPSASPSVPPSATPAPAPPAPIRLLWDSDCPLCVAEVNGLRRRAASFSPPPVVFVDVADVAYDASANGGVGYAAAMGKIHAVTGDGEVVAGVEVFRRVYAALGMGWLYAPTKLPVIGGVVDWAYDVWAENRMRITGRESREVVIAEQERAVEKARKALEEGRATCDEDECSI